MTFVAETRSAGRGRLCLTESREVLSYILSLFVFVIYLFIFTIEVRLPVTTGQAVPRYIAVWMSGNHVQRCKL